MFRNLSPALLGISGRDSEIIELVLSHGFKGLDLDLVEFEQQAQSQGLAKAARLITSARLKIGSFPLPVRWEHDSPDYAADMRRLEQLAPLAKELGCTRTTTLVEAESESRPYHQNFEFHRQRLAEIAGALKPHDIRLGVGYLAPLACRQGQAFQFMQTFDEVNLLLRSVGAANVGFALDSWHWHLGGGKLESLATLKADAIVTVTLADAEPTAAAADVQPNARRMPGDGGIDLVGLLAELGRLRYDGPVTPAPDRSQLAEQGRDKIVKAAGEALDKVWKAAGLNNLGRVATVAPRS